MSLCKEISLPMVGIVISLAELILVVNTNFYISAFTTSSSLLIASLVYLNYRYRQYNQYNSKNNEPKSLINTIDQFEQDDDSDEEILIKKYS